MPLPNASPVQEIPVLPECVVQTLKDYWNLTWNEFVVLKACEREPYSAKQGLHPNEITPCQQEIVDMLRVRCLIDFWPSTGRYELLPMGQIVVDLTGPMAHATPKRQRVRRGDVLSSKGRITVLEVIPLDTTRES